MDRRHSSFKRRHEPWLDKDRERAVLRKVSGNSRRGARSIRKLRGNCTHAIRDNGLLSQTWNPNSTVKPNGQTELRWVSKRYWHYIMSWREKAWIWLVLREPQRVSPTGILLVLFAFGTRPFLDRNCSTSFTSALWMADRGLLKWNDYLSYWQTKQISVEGWCRWLPARNSIWEHVLYGAKRAHVRYWSSR